MTIFFRERYVHPKALGHYANIDYSMFSGIIEVQGEVEKADKNSLAIKAKISKIKPGASISVNGVCLTTLWPLKKSLLNFDLSPETLRLTTLGGLVRGQIVNLEPALKIGDPLGGHLVSGHVDAVARVISKINLPGGFASLRIETPRALKNLIAKKGSVTIDGVSLTVADITKKYFEIALVPYTLSHTTLGGLKKGDQVNLEADMLARYVQACLQSSEMIPYQKTIKNDRRAILK